MKPCKHLDHDESKHNHPDCELKTVQLFSGPVKFWSVRSACNKSDHQFQFCKLKWMIDKVFACYHPDEMSCHSENEG